MPTPLWTRAPKRTRGWSVPSTRHRFTVRDETFLYDPDDMRLWHEEGSHTTPSGALSVRPSFPLHVPTPGMLVLVLTRACPLRCRYCFVEEDNASTTLSLAHAQQAIALLDPARDLRVSFFGGEPLLAWTRMREIANHTRTLAQQRGVNARFGCTTSGVLLDADRARWFDQNQFSLIISIDGPEHLHNAARPLASGGGSYARARAGLEHIARHPQLARRTTLRATFDGSDTKAHLLERLIHLNELADTYGFANVSVEPADLSEGCSRGSAPVTPTPSLRAEYLDAAQWAATRMQQGHPARFHHLQIRMQRLQHRTPAPSECGAGLGYLSVDPEGQIHPCHRLGDTPLGTVERGIDPLRQAHWRDNRYTARDRCPTCWMRNVCGGGCRWTSVHRWQTLREPDPLGCWLTEVCTHAAAWLLWTLHQSPSPRSKEIHPCTPS